MRLLVLMLSVGAALLGATAVSGCGGGDGGGDGLPDDAVAQVGDSVITESDFETALKLATGRGHDPRDYAACVAGKQQPTSETGGTQQTDAQLEKQCRDEYETIKSNVMDYLIRAEWTRKEAEARGIVVDDAEVDRAVEKAQGSLLDKETLTRAGVSERQLIVRIRQNLLQSRVTEQVTEQARKLSTQDIQNYYRRNRKQLVVPDRRDLRIVITRTRAKAEAARAALEAGRSWNSVAREYSLHFSRDQGGRVIDARRGSNRKVGLGAAIFGARTGELTGPVMDDDTWAVFVVDKIKPSYQPTLEQAHDDISERLQSTREKQALDAYTKKYRDETTCASGFKVSVCKNGPEQMTDQPSA
jgi:foldase protein PrsA